MMHTYQWWLITGTVITKNKRLIWAASRCPFLSVMAVRVGENTTSYVLIKMK